MKLHVSDYTRQLNHLHCYAILGEETISDPEVGVYYSIALDSGIAVVGGDSLPKWWFHVVFNS